MWDLLLVASVLAAVAAWNLRHRTDPREPHAGEYALLIAVVVGAGAAARWIYQAIR